MEPAQNAPPEDVRDQVSQDGTSGAGPSAASTGQPSLPTLQELRDLPRRLLPEETYTHLQNAGREAALAVFSLWRSIDSARLGKQSEKVRKHIDVE